MTIIIIRNYKEKQKQSKKLWKNIVDIDFKYLFVCLLLLNLYLFIHFEVLALDINLTCIRSYEKLSTPLLLTQESRG